MSRFAAGTVESLRIFFLALIALSSTVLPLRAEKPSPGNSSPGPNEVQSSNAPNDEENLLASVHFDPDQNYIILPITFGNQKYNFLLDTGTNRHVFDWSLMFALGEPRKRAIWSCQWTSKSRKWQRQLVIHDEYELPTPATLGGVAIRGEVECWDLSELRDAIGQNVQGVLGQRFLRDRIVQIDFDEGRLRVFKEGTAPKGSWGIPLETVGPGAYLVPLAHPDEDFRFNWFWIDTGWNGTIAMGPPVFGWYCNDGHLRPSREAEQTSAVSDDQRKMATVSQLSWGPFSQRELSVKESAVRPKTDLWSRISGPPVHQNFVGLDYLSRFHLTLDITSGRVFVRKAKSYQDATDEIPPNQPTVTCR